MPTCSCNQTVFQHDNTTYCTINRENIGADVYVTIDYIPRNSTKFYIKNPYYILTYQTIFYNDTTNEWNQQTIDIRYGCNWNLCNKPELVPKLLSTLTLSLPIHWLNTFIIGTNPSTCHQCQSGSVCENTNFTDFSSCPVVSCKGSCVMSDLFENFQAGLPQFCYQSICFNNTDSNIDTHRIDIEGIYYLDTEEFNIWEIDVYCRANNCSRPEIFNEIRSNLKENINIEAFLYTATATTPVSHSAKIYVQFYVLIILVSICIIIKR
ncbi:unnamed protein product [Didymodactylos carnosus]|uniref:Uncharacterized protein n=1 Tax=Didymodactylos carnosus TaxID=1234261 RepID=A0A815F0R3_9BILA|nr:unnamed protein product [Didymodactylos carnosus]CAF1317295.1 unnamed protein product [Didymodactylos carnosus]CAF3960447.1 unnamed protein product [Didymodactylos carnosus]CAF4160176.1 unnamed protein product [Didymodactylos carnosus]